MAELRFRKAQVKSEVHDAAMSGLRKAAMRLVRDVRMALNQSGWTGAAYTPSEPGGYPHKDTGNLRKSIDWWEDTSLLAVEVGANEDAPYWSDLEYGTVNMADRPYLRPRAHAIKSELEAIVGSAIKIKAGGS